MRTLLGFCDRTPSALTVGLSSSSIDSIVEKHFSITIAPVRSRGGTLVKNKCVEYLRIARMFAELELVSRYPCVLSAPFLSSSQDMDLAPRELVLRPGDDDHVLRFIYCRDEGQLAPGKKRNKQISGELIRMVPPTPSNTYIHTYHSRFIPEWVAEVSQIFLRDTHVLPKFVSYKEHCRRDRW
jgi:hypothetical protein